MKKMLSTLIVILVAVLFTVAVFAADVPTSESAGAAPDGEMRKDEAKPIMRHHRHHRHHHHHHHKHNKGAMKDAKPAPRSAVPVPPVGQ